MLQQSTIFDAIATNSAKERGISVASEGKQHELRFAQDVAREIGRRQGRVTADDVIRELIEVHGWQEGQLGNAAGGIFRGSSWTFTGETVKSQRVSSHGRLIRVWRFNG
jgi:hypothetical protein